uniref:Uncharacterized protein n=1 Tax=Solanum lycopersicum TaxID=4081 RepID=A0A3Q7EVK3_SOLLC
MPSGLYFTPDDDQGVLLDEITDSTLTTALHWRQFSEDYIAIMEGDLREGKHNISIFMQPKFSTISKHTNAVLSEIEVFKISNPDNNHGSVSPVHLVASTTPEKSEESVLFYTKNQIATVPTFRLTLINVAVYHIRCDAENKSIKTNN